MVNNISIEALYVVDDEYTSAALQLQQKAERAQEIWDSYIEISKMIVGAQGSLQGLRADAYRYFINSAEGYVESKLSEIVAEAAKDKKDYIEMIDEADSVLYD